MPDLEEDIESFLITFMDDIKPKGVANVCARVNVLYKLHRQEEGLSVERQTAPGR